MLYFDTFAATIIPPLECQLMKGSGEPITGQFKVRFEPFAAFTSTCDSKASGGSAISKENYLRYI